MIITTLQSIEGFKVTNYLGVISANSVKAVGYFGDITARVVDVVGGSSKTYEKTLEEGIESAMEKLEITGDEVRADALLGVTINVCTFSTAKGGFLVITVSATAVKGEKA